MIPHPSPPEAPRRRFVRRSVVLSFVGLITSSCSGPALTGTGIEVSSMPPSQPSAVSTWDCDSLPVSGNANELFSDLGPDYFGELLRNLPAVEGAN